ncbi:MAG: Na/Pi cotransporter family protein, partial [Bacteroidales bacterium]|nr:Na/Pi cotransporter family protein [Bacteroidales bacterium]
PTMAGQTERLPVVLAMFHTCFNVANTTVLIGFVPQLERVVRWILPDRKQTEEESFQLQYIKANIIQTPEIAVLEAQNETAHFSSDVCKMFGKVRELFTEDDSKRFDERFADIEKAEDNSDKMELGIARFLEQLSDDHLSDVTKTKTRQLLREIGELESIGDACYNLSRTMNRMQLSGKTLDEEQTAQLLQMMALCDEALQQMDTTMHGHRDQHDIQQTYRIENAINQKRDQLKAGNLQAVNDQRYDYATGSIYADLVSEMEKLGDYVVNVVEARFGV